MWKKCLDAVRYTESERTTARARERARQWSSAVELPSEDQKKQDVVYMVAYESPKNCNAGL